MVGILVIFVHIPSILLFDIGWNDGNEKNISTSYSELKIHSFVSSDKILG